MSLRINNNSDAMSTLRQLNLSQSSYSQALQRLSSGKRINSAADDAAGYAISQKLLAQSNGLTQAATNTQDAISLVQTATGGLQTISSMLQRLRQLAVQAANDTNTTSDRQALQLEANQIATEVNQISTTTQYNGKNLIDGTLGTSVSSTGYSALGGSLGTANVTVAGGTLATGTYTLTLGAVTAGTKSTASAAGTVVTSGTLASSTAIDDTINGLRTTTTPVSVTAALGSGTLAVTTNNTTIFNTTSIVATQLAAGTWTVKIVSVQGAAANGTWSTSGSDSITVSNGVSTYTLYDTQTAGYFNSSDGTHALPTGFALDLRGFGSAGNTAAAGGTTSFTVTRTVGVNTSANQSITITDENGKSASISLLSGDTFAGVVSRINAAGLQVSASFNGNSAGSAGIQLVSQGPNQAAGITVVGSDNALMGLGLEAAGTAAAATTNSVTISGNTGTADSIGATYLSSATNTAYSGSGALLSYSGAGVFTDAVSGFKINLTNSTTSLTGGATATLNVSNNAATMQVGANAGQSLSVNIAGTSAAQLGIAGSTAGTAIDLTSVTAAGIALTAVDAAINSVNAQSATLGAVQNRLTNAYNNVNIGAQNLQSAYGNITNVDMAAESTMLATSQVLQQSGVAMLAQANQAPQLVLKLLG